jgi:hypothetical protein
MCIKEEVIVNNAKFGQKFINILQNFAKVTKFRIFKSNFALETFSKFGFAKFCILPSCKEVAP